MEEEQHCALEDRSGLGNNPSPVKDINPASTLGNNPVAVNQESYQHPDDHHDGVIQPASLEQLDNLDPMAIDEPVHALRTLDSLEETLSKSPPRSSQKVSKQFWRAGEFFPDHDPLGLVDQAGLHHARLHPRFLHSNATSHKWALGAFVELLDNSMDEVGAGCTYVKVDKVDHPGQGSQNPMLLVEDNGGGMNPTVIRNCMSFGFSMKKGKQMIGQYGNGFKTSTMRLGADALVLTKSKSTATCSVGLLSFTFLSATKSQDVIVPIVDYNLHERTRMMSDDEDWQNKLSLICRWGPFESEAELWKQFDSMPSQGTRVYIWNLWQTSDGVPELDFLSNSEDICLQGGEEEMLEVLTRKRKADEGMKRCHAYRHSLRAYVAILYLKWPEGFKISIRGKEVVPDPVSRGMKHNVTYEYRPRQLPKEESVVADVSGPVVVAVHIGFADEAPDTNVSGFCVYHRNRLIKPYWKVYSSASSVGRGVIGYLQVDFVEPAHDKQDFENTPPLQKLEKYLKRQVPLFWRNKAHYIGYQEGYSAPAAKTAATEQATKTSRARVPPVSREAEAIAADVGERPALMTQQSTPAATTRIAQAQNVLEHTDRPVVLDDEMMAARERERGQMKKGAEPPSSLPVASKSSRVAIPKQDVATDNLPQVIPKGWNWAEKERAGPVCMQHMKREVSNLQEGMQAFCNMHQIGHKAQGDLGKIFGTSISNILNPVKALSTVCAVQMGALKTTLTWLSELRGRGALLSPFPESLADMMSALDIPITSPPSRASPGPATASGSAHSSPPNPPADHETHPQSVQGKMDEQPSGQPEGSQDGRCVDAVANQEVALIDKEEQHGTGVISQMDRVQAIQSLPLGAQVGSMANTQGTVHQGVLSDVQRKSLGVPAISSPVFPTAGGGEFVDSPEMILSPGSSGDHGDICPSKQAAGVPQVRKRSAGCMQANSLEVLNRHSGERISGAQNIGIPDTSIGLQHSSRTVSSQNVARGKKTHSMEQLGRSVVEQFLQGKPQGPGTGVAESVTTPYLEVSRTKADLVAGGCEDGRGREELSMPHTAGVVGRQPSSPREVETGRNYGEDDTDMCAVGLPGMNGNQEDVSKTSMGELRRDPTLEAWVDEDGKGVKRSLDAYASLGPQEAKRFKPSTNGGGSAEVDFVVPSGHMQGVSEETVFEKASMGDVDMVRDQSRTSEEFERVHVEDDPRTGYGRLAEGGLDEHRDHPLPHG